MLIPEDILQKQLCFKCEKYLSVDPIKVYPNRQVKCGRCSYDYDIGVVSKLFSTVLQNVQFPCVNKYAGCDAQENLQEMRFHEDTCKEYSSYECLICAQFDGTAFRLKKHCESAHKKEILQFPMFFIDFSEENHKKCYFYLKENNIMSFVTYTIDSEKIELDILFPADMYKGEVLYQFTIRTIENALLFKTELTPCSQLQHLQRSSVYIDKSKLITEKQKIICQFRMVENKITVMKVSCLESNILIPTADEGIFRYKFNKLDRLDIFTDHHIPGINYILNIPLEVFIYLTKDSSSDSSFLVYLKWHGPRDDDSDEKCIFNSACTLRNSDICTRQYVKQEKLKSGRQTQIFSTAIDEVFDLQYESFEVEVKIKVYLPEPESPVCKRAQIQCDCSSCCDSDSD